MEQEKQLDRSYVPGDIVTINQTDWTIAEILDEKIRLYRERVDGRSQTMDVSEEELERLTDR
ncbi:MAG: hypothetical protein HQ509_08970 [Candidatus Marinimicrobia bacterium]|mgnify:CR=1 FL=1|nr:hypothetical protein [Candidatus Neomarinimicrobiota bacterium]